MESVVAAFVKGTPLFFLAERHKLLSAAYFHDSIYGGLGFFVRGEIYTPSVIVEYEFDEVKESVAEFQGSGWRAVCGSVPPSFHIILKPWCKMVFGEKFYIKNMCTQVNYISCFPIESTFKGNIEGVKAKKTTGRSAIDSRYRLQTNIWNQSVLTSSTSRHSAIRCEINHDW